MGPVPRLLLVLLMLVTPAAAQPVPVARPLEGKVVVLDPGHGGSASGAEAPRGLREADLNLEVSRRLRERLLAQGAQVVMTRVADTDTLIASPFVLSADLASRAAISNYMRADLFVSLHHNAFAQKVSSQQAVRQNRTEVYYNMFDSGASHALGVRMFETLWLLLKAKSSELLPSTFAVLRNNEQPAVLGEPYYMTSEVYERYARTPLWMDTEANQYQAGIDAFLQRSIEPGRVQRPIHREMVTRLPYEILVSVPPGSRMTTPVLKLGKETLDLQAIGEGLLVASLPDVPNGDQQLTFDLVGAAQMAPTVRRKFIVDFPPAAIDAEFVPPSLDPQYAGPLIVRVSLKDRRGHPVRDGTLVSLGLVPAATEATTAPGTVLGTGTTRDGSADVWVGAPPVAPLLERGIMVLAGDIHRGFPVPSSVTPVSSAQARILDEKSQKPVGRLHFSLLPAVGIGHGWAPETGTLLVGGRPGPVNVRLEHGGYVIPGLLPLDLTREPAPVVPILPLKPVLGGALHGQSFVLDAEVTGPSISFFNVIETLFEDTGLAEIHDTTAAGPGASAQERVLLTNRFPSTVAVRFAGLAETMGGTVEVQHYYSSSRGKEIAQGVVKAFQAAGFPARAVGGGTYFINNTPATGLEIAFGSGTRFGVREAAYLVYRGLAHGIMPMPGKPGKIAGTAEGAGRDTWVYLDTGDRTHVDDKGKFTFHLVPEGPHTVWYAISGTLSGFGVGRAITLTTTPYSDPAPSSQGKGKPGRRKPGRRNRRRG